MADLEQREREALLKGRQVDTWVPWRSAARGSPRGSPQSHSGGHPVPPGTPLPGHDPAVRAALVAEARRCAACGDPIPAERLRARPDATLCIECQEEHERGA